MSRFHANSKLSENNAKDLGSGLNKLRIRRGKSVSVPFKHQKMAKMVRGHLLVYQYLIYLHGKCNDSQNTCIDDLRVAVGWEPKPWVRLIGLLTNISVGEYKTLKIRNFQRRLGETNKLKIEKTDEYYQFQIRCKGLGV